LAPATAWTAACAQCDRLACLSAVRSGHLPEGAEHIDDPIKSSLDLCAMSAMGCFTESNCPKR
jgi:hypothetical protein